MIDQVKNRVILNWPSSNNAETDTDADGNSQHILIGK